jgi:hypothetical protein
MTKRLLENTKLSENYGTHFYITYRLMKNGFKFRKEV